MPKPKVRNTAELLFDTIFEAMHEKKAENILLLDLSKIKGTNFDYFVITHGNSTSQVNAIAEEVRRKVKTVCHLNPAHAEGFANAEWILLDYLDVVVHIFQQEVRDHYQLENLWADAIITPIEEEIPVRKTVVKKEPTTKEVIKKEIAKKTIKKDSKDALQRVSTKKTAKNHERKSTTTKSTTTKSTAKSTPKSKSTKSSKKA
ncbi:MAG: ribosome silencing factor [Bacteroidales bacterium]|jgi:ribosome-associated protein|nr:ribosome silencing factor [Bacteroidales bacterium]